MTSSNGKRKIILSIDIGSSSVRCSAYSWNDASTVVEALVGCSSSRPIQAAAAGTRQPILDLLLEYVDNCVEDTLQCLRQRQQQPNNEFRIIAVGFSTFVMNLIGLDKDGNIVDGATITYACNSPRVAQECQLLQTLIGLDQRKVFHQRTGCPLHSAYALPQLRIFYKKNDSNKIHRWQTLSSLIVSRWIGQTSSLMQLPISFSEASWTGLLNIHNCEWDTELLSYLPPSCVKALPPLQDITTQQFLVISKYRKDTHEIINPYWCQWPELREEEGCQLFLGVGDGAAATIGSKCTSSTASPRISVTIGTSAATRLCRWYPRANTASDNTINSENDTPLIIPDGLWCYRITQEYVLVGGALTDGGSVIEFCRTLLNLKTDAEFTSCMEEVRTLMQHQDYHDHNSQIENDNNSVTNNTEIFLPFLGGERSVGFRLGATAALCGITHQTTPARFVLSCMEGVTLQLNEILTLLLKSMDEKSSKGPRPVLVVSGNALERNQLWRQMIANCTEMDVVMDSEVNECTSRGVAKLIAAILSSQWQQNKDPTTPSNLFSSLGEEEIMHPFDVCYPSPMTKANWSKKKYLQKELIQAVSKTWAPSFSHTSST